VSSAQDCVFCRIVSGELPATLLAEGEHAVAFRDLAPVAPVHVLVVPRRHVQDASVLDASHGEVLAEMTALAAQVALEEGIASGGYRLVFNVGEDAGNTVPHLHLHLIGGRSLAWPPG
jgi:histidine triad (HIT) family protein